MRKLFVGTRWSHVLIPVGDGRDPVEKRALWLALVAVIVAGSACSRSLLSTAVPSAASPAIPPGLLADPGELSRDLMAFADDSMRGRETGTSDATRAAFFLGRRLAALGLEPAGDSMYYQRVPMVRQVISSSTRLHVTLHGVTRPLRIGEDLVPLLALGDGQPDPRRRVSAPIVFAGYGMTSPSLNRDDFASIDLTDRVAVIIHGSPPGVTGALSDSLNSDAELSSQLARVALKQPAAIIILMTGPANKLFRQIYPNLMRDVRGSLTAPQSIAGLQIPMVLFGTATRGSPLLPAAWPADDRPQALTGREFTAEIEVAREQFTGYNVVARVPGSDPALRRTYVALGAHYDHVGILPALNGDSIANGADDDGSGSVALLAIARRLVSAPTRRSVLFVWHTGEEKGLLGSTYFTANPTVPLDSIVAQLNADMIGRNAAESLYVVGPRAAPNGLARRLGEIVDSVNATQSIPFVFDRRWDDASHPEQIFQRSDHISYARRGIPVAFFTTGMHVDYHEVGDEPSRINFLKLARVTTLLAGVTRAIGNATDRPR